MKKITPPLFLLVLAGFAAAADWPQWRGPNRDDVSKETGLLQSWPKEGPKLLWTFRNAGEGYSAPVIIGDMMYCMGADSQNETIYALDLRTQMKKWSTPINPRKTLDRGDGPRGATAADGDLLYGLSSQGVLICVKASNGDKSWSVDCHKDLGGDMQSGWGYSESPLVDGDQVVCTPGGKNGTMAALNKKTGEVIWRSKDWTDKAAYASIVAADLRGVHQYVQMTGDNVAGVDAKTGNLLWKFPRKGPTAAIPTPIVSGDFVFVSSGYGAGCNLIKITKDGDTFKADGVYDDKDIINHHGGVVLVDGYLYSYSDKGGWVCKELLTGKVQWSKDKKDTKIGKGSLTCADGCLYCYSEDEGTCVLVQASPEGWKEKGRFTVPETSKNHGKQNGGKFWTHPVVANGKLYLRDQDLIWCYDVKAGMASR